MVSLLKERYIRCLSWVGLKIEIHEIHHNLRNPISLIGPIVSETCWNQRSQPPTLSGRRTWTVDEIEVASSLNFSILVECFRFI